MGRGGGQACTVASHPQSSYGGVAALNKKEQGHLSPSWRSQVGAGAMPTLLIPRSRRTGRQAHARSCHTRAHTCWIMENAPVMRAWLAMMAAQVASTTWHMRDQMAEF